MSDDGGTILHFPTQDSDPPLGHPYGDRPGDTYPPEQKPPSKTATLLAEGIALVEGDRAAQHGDKHALHTTMADIMTGYLRRCQLPLTKQNAAGLEVCMKLARTLHGAHNDDDFRDGSVYFAMMGELADGEPRGA